MTFQLIGGSAILLGLYGTWLAAQRRVGWLICVASSALWFPTLVTGAQWAAVLNCTVSIGICLRNFRSQEPPGIAERTVRASVTDVQVETDLVFGL
jgi:hypothetical protein